MVNIADPDELRRREESLAEIRDRLDTTDDPDEFRFLSVELADQLLDRHFFQDAHADVFGAPDPADLGEIVERADQLQSVAPGQAGGDAIRLALGVAHAVLFDTDQGRSHLDLALEHLTFAVPRIEDPDERWASWFDVAGLLISRYSEDPAAHESDLASATEVLTQICAEPGPDHLRHEAKILLARTTSEQANIAAADAPAFPALVRVALEAFEEARCYVTDPVEQADLETQAGRLCYQRHVLRSSDGEAGDLDRAIDLLTPAAGAGLADGHSLWMLGQALKSRYESKGTVADRDAAITICTTALDGEDLADFMAADCLESRGRLLLERYECDEEPDDLKGSLSDLRAARDCTEPGDDTRWLAVLALAEAVMYSVGTRAGPAEIAETADCLRELLLDIPQQDEFRTATLMRLVYALTQQVQRSQRWVAELDDLLPTMMAGEASLRDDEELRYLINTLIGTLYALRYMMNVLTASTDPADAQTAMDRLQYCLDHPLPEQSPLDQAHLHGLLAMLRWGRVTESLGWDPHLGLTSIPDDDSWVPGMLEHPDLSIAAEHMGRLQALGGDAGGPVPAMFRLMAGLRGADDLEEGQLRDLTAPVPDLDLAEPVMTPVILQLQGVHLIELARRTGRPEDADRAVEAFSRALAALLPGHPARPSGLHQLGNALALRCELRPSAANAEAAVQAICETAELATLNGWDLPGIDDDLARAVVGASGFDLPAACWHGAAAILRRPAGNASAGIELQSFRLRHLALEVIRTTVPTLRAAADLPQDRRLPIGQAERGRAALECHRRTGDPGALASAIEHLERAGLMIGHDQPTESSAAVMIDLAEAYSQQGDAERAITTGRRALHEFAQTVLLSPTTDAALAVARAANEHVERMSGWCLARDDLRRAIRVLEAGRGLVLHAATTSTQVPNLLRSSRHPDLADAWQNDVADEQVRGQGLTALPRSPAGMKLLMPFSTDDFDPLLWAAELDALVYLVPGTDGPGAAILVRVGDDLHHLPLPDLRLEPGGQLERSRAAHRAAFLDIDTDTSSGDVDLASDPAVQTWRRALEQLSEWAYDVAIGPILEHVADWQLPRPSRLALVPTGSLAHVPWHAARRAGPGGWRYACQQAVFSYASSARQLAEVSRRSRLPLTAAPAFVANPTGTQVWPSICAGAARTAFYPDATYLGHPLKLSAGARGTAMQVLAQFPSADFDGASMLQLSSHASVHDSPGESYFELAGGERLSVAQILNQGSGRRPEAAGGLVICDSCMTDLTEHDHDEVLTLGTAFLAVGAASVIGARWPLDDAMAAVMMFVLHHQLSLGLRPADALRAAQLWMLDAQRTPPPMMPAELAGEVTRTDLADLVAWGAFTHQGL